MPRLEGDAVEGFFSYLIADLNILSVTEFWVSCMQFLFGDDVRTIVEGETKFSKIGQLSANEGKSVDVKARDLQHLFLAMTKEVSPLHFILTFKDSSLHPHFSVCKPNLPASSLIPDHHGPHTMFSAGIKRPACVK